MREILFHGKRKDNGEWVEGSLWVFDDYADISYRDQEYSEIVNTVEVDPETVGQYTGMRDCKRTEEYPDGQMIFEGDIVVCNRHINDVFDKKKFLVRECDFRFGLVGESLSGNEISGDEWEFAEVIGNIHDNPELLKEGGEE